jgi:hypothetical protein
MARTLFLVFALLVVSLFATFSNGATQTTSIQPYREWFSDANQNDTPALTDSTYSSKPTTGVIQLGEAGGASPADYLQIISYGHGINNETYKIRIYAYKSTNCPAQQVCLLTCALGQKTVVKEPITGTSITALWGDTQTVTDNWPGTISTDAVTDEIAITTIPVNGFEYWTAVIEDCNGPGEASEPNDITILYCTL